MKFSFIVAGKITAIMKISFIVAVASIVAVNDRLPLICP